MTLKSLSLAVILSPRSQMEEEVYKVVDEDMEDEMEEEVEKGSTQAHPANYALVTLSPIPLLGPTAPQSVVSIIGADFQPLPFPSQVTQRRL